jgi:hypothetical protein
MPTRRFLTKSQPNQSTEGEDHGSQRFRQNRIGSRRAQGERTQDGIRQLLSKKTGTLDYVKALPPKETDMDGIGPDGKPVPGYKAVGTGSPPKIKSHDPAKPHQMKLTQEEQDIMDGKKGPAHRPPNALRVPTRSQLSSVPKVSTVAGLRARIEF